MQKLIPLFSILLVASLGIFYPLSLPLFIIVSLVGIIYILWQQKQKGFKPQSDTYKELEKIKKKRVKVEDNKHKHINDQVAYIAEVWGYTKEQEKIIEKFIEGRAYSEMYNKLTASLFPQMITLIDYCNERGQKGCKREVSRRLRELTTLMKDELQKKKMLKSESYETTLEVYDQIIKGG
jgi:hypothetical protein